MSDLGHFVLHQLPGQRVDLRVEIVRIVEVTENYQLPEGGRGRERGRITEEGERQQSLVQTGVETRLRME